MAITFEDLINEYMSTGHLFSIPKEEGTYKVLIPKEIDMKIKAVSDATKSTKEPYAVIDLEEKWKDINQYDEPDNRVVYIGKAKNLQERTRQFVRFAMGIATNHMGGRALWQIENNRKLEFHYVVEGNARVREKEMILDFENRHGGTKPFANNQS